MSCELVTGTAGTPHITSKQVAAFNQALTARSVCILDTKNRLLTSAEGQELVINSGDLMVQGRHVTCEEPTTLSFKPCGFNKSRIDYAAIRYEKDVNTGFENASWVIIEGSETLGNPTPPVIQKGNIDDGLLLVDFAVYQVTIKDSGITKCESVAFRLTQSAVLEFEQNGWHIRQFPDGVNEVYGVFTTKAMAIDNAFGVLFSGDSFYPPKYPALLFNENPTVTVTVTASADGTPGAGCTLTQGTRTAPPRVTPIYPKAIKDAKKYEVHIVARGKRQAITPID